MVYNKSHDTAGARRVFERLAADKKKTAFAISLLAVMVFLWFRVFMGHQPGPAAASPAPTDVQTTPPKPPVNICYFTLPHVPGRNDYINRDFFAARDWECFRPNDSSRPKDPGARADATASDRSREAATRAAQKLELQAVLQDGNPRAFVNDRLLGVGDRITVRDGADTCDFEVLRIYNDSVLVGCNETRLTLKLTKHLDVSN